MIFETIVATAGDAGEINCAPMGIELDGGRVLLRPFRTARTWSNLRDTGEGVVNFTDNVLIFARCALNPYLPPHRPASRVRGVILEDSCHWKEFVVTAGDLSGDRGRFDGRIVAEGRARDSLGFNRARHAVIEATILATRLFLLGRDSVLSEIDRLRPLVEKTGGEQEREAFALLEQRILESRHAG